MRGEPPILVMKQNGSILNSGTAMECPSAVVRSGPAAGVLSAAAVAADLGLAKVIALESGGTSTHISLIEDEKHLSIPITKINGHYANIPSFDIKSVGIGGGSILRSGPAAGLRVGPQSAGAEPGPMCFGAGGKEPTVTDALLFLGRLPDALAGGEIPLDRTKAEEGIKLLSKSLKQSHEETALAVVEETAKNLAQAIKRMTVNRGKDPREYTIIAFGGLAPLIVADVAALLGIRNAVVPSQSSCLSAIGLAEAELRNEYSSACLVRLTEESGEGLSEKFEKLQREAESDLNLEEVPEDERLFSRSMDIRYANDPQELTIDIPPGLPFPAALEKAIDAFREAYRFQNCGGHEAHSNLEVVNLRLTALGREKRRERKKIPSKTVPPDIEARERPILLQSHGKTSAQVYDGALPGKGDTHAGPAAIEEAGSTAFIPPGGSFTIDEWGNACISLPSSPGPPVHEMIKGMLDTALREMIACLERTARSHLIRDMGAFHAALFDREGRFVAGRPCSTTIAPILMNWPPEEIRDGDVFLWNDVFLSEGGPGQMANICVSTPVYHRDILVAFSLICCRHDDMAGMAPGGVPAGATDILQEGLRIPPIKYYERGIINETARRILFQNTRKSQSLQAGWSAQIASCRIGASRVKDLFGRFGEERVIGHFDEILDKCEKKVSELFLSKIPDGAHRWEDFIESDGVNRRKRHALRINMTKKSGKLTLDFRGTSPQASGPINWQANSDGGIFLRKWLGAILLHLAEDPGQISEIEFNQGICRLIDISLPPPGTLITPGLLAPTGMSAFTLYRLQSLFLGVLGLATGGKMPADQDRLHCWGFHGKEIGEKFFLFQEILAGGGGGSPLRDGEDAYRRSHHFSSLGGLLSSEVIESQFPLRLERQGISMDSGGPGMCRGGLGQFKEYRILKDVEVFHLSGRAKFLRGA